MASLFKEVMTWRHNWTTPHQFGFRWHGDAGQRDTEQISEQHRRDATDAAGKSLKPWTVSQRITNCYYTRPLQQQATTTTTTPRRYHVVVVRRETPWNRVVEKGRRFVLYRRVPDIILTTVIIGVNASGVTGVRTPNIWAKGMFR